MQLNEIHNPSEHASVSLKTILLVFAIVLIGVLGYLVYQQNTEVDNTDYSVPKTKTEEKTDKDTTLEKTTTTNETADWKTYTSSKYKLSFKYPTDWKITESTPDSNSAEPFSYYGQYVSFQPLSVTQDFLGYIAFAPKTTYNSTKANFIGTVGVVSSKEEETTLAGNIAKKVTAEKISGSITMTLIMYAVEIGNVGDVPHYAYFIGDSSLSSDTAVDKEYHTKILRIFNSVSLDK